METSKLEPRTSKEADLEHTSRHERDVDVRQADDPGRCSPDVAETQLNASAKVGGSLSDVKGEWMIMDPLSTHVLPEAAGNARDGGSGQRRPPVARKQDRLSFIGQVELQRLLKAVNDGSASAQVALPCLQQACMSCTFPQASVVVVRELCCSVVCGISVRKPVFDGYWTSRRGELRPPSRFCGSGSSARTGERGPGRSAALGHAALQPSEAQGAVERITSVSLERVQLLSGDCFMFPDSDAMRRTPLPRSKNPTWQCSVNVMCESPRKPTCA